MAIYHTTNENLDRWDRQRTETSRNHVLSWKRANLARALTMASRSLCGRPVQVSIVPDGPAPAWSSATEVFLKTNTLGSFTANEVFAAYGLWVHEQAHILYTPRNSSEIVRWVNERGWFHYFNVLEDQRIETLLLGRFPNMLPWLQGAITAHLLKSADTSTLFPLVRGRRYLPLDLRRSLRMEYRQQEHVREIAEVIDAYRTVLYPADTEKAKALIQRFADALGDLPIPPRTPHGGNPCTADSNSDSRQVPLSEQRKDRDKAEKIEGAEDVLPESDEDEDDDAEAVASGGGSEETSGEETSEESGNGGAEADSDDDSDGSGSEAGGSEGDDLDDFDDEDDTAEALDDETFGGVGSGPSDVPDVRDMLSDLLDEVLDAVSSDLSEIRSGLDHPPVDDADTDAWRTLTDWSAASDWYVSAESRTTQVGDTTRLAAVGLRRELEALRSNAEPYWERETSSGRLNAGRWMIERDFDSAFDRWDEGKEEATDIEAVILVDMSSSMDSGIRTRKSNETREDVPVLREIATQALWALQHSLDYLDARVTVLGFNDSAYTLVRPGTKASPAEATKVVTWGGTSPLPTLDVARRILAASTRHVKIMLTITDGWWDGADACEKVIAAMNTQGVLTGMVFLSPEQGWDSYQERVAKQQYGDRWTEVLYRHDCQVFRAVSSQSDLTAFGADLVRKAIRDAMAR